MPAPEVEELSATAWISLSAGCHRHNRGPLSDRLRACSGPLASGVMRALRARGPAADSIAALLRDGLLHL